MNNFQIIQFQVFIQSLSGSCLEQPKLCINSNFCRPNIFIRSIINVKSFQK